MTIAKDVQEIKIMMATVSNDISHVKESIKEFKQHTTKTCPANRKDIYDKIDFANEQLNRIKGYSIKNTAVLGILLTLLFFLMNKFMV